MTHEPPLLQVRDLKVDFAGVPAVRGVSFDLAPGEVLGIVGESGSGKSVTSLAVLGLLPSAARASGSVRLGGTELLGAPESLLDGVRGARVSMVFQDPLSAFTPVYRVGEQIAEAVRAHQDVSREKAARRAVELLDLVGIPEPRRRASAFPHEFSGGMRQRAMIAMAVANDPEVILADEPTTALDVTIQAQVLDVLRTAQRATGAAMVLVSHDLGVIAGSADRVAVMYAGRVVETAPAGELFARPRMPYTLGLIGAVPRLDGPRGRLTPVPGGPPSPEALPPGCPFAPRCPLAAPECESAEPGPSAWTSPSGDHRAACVRVARVSGRTPGEIFVDGDAAAPAGTEAEAGRQEEAGTLAEAPQGSPAPVVLRVRDLTKTFPLYKGSVFRRRTGSVYAVDGVDLEVRAGQTLGLVGESGSGKSTTLYEILGLRPPENGTIELLGQSVADLDRAATRRLRSGVQIVFQDPMASLDPRMPVSDLVAEPLRAQGAAPSRIAARVPELLSLVGLSPDRDADRFPHEFSGGQRQRIGIARALSVNPDLLVLDEPVSALDVSVQAGVLNLLQDLRHRLNLAYLFVSHDLSVVRHVADRVSVMYLGATVEAGPVDEVFERPRHPYTQALLSAVPIPDPVRERARERVLLPGDPPSPTERPTGCRFRSRCPLYATLPSPDRERCETVRPRVGPGSPAACHFPRVREVVGGGER
ncbi:dipeptide ABC transporter ATP-binding protein [Streptomyces sp. NPDC007088]|uniref:ABC transporter ATP-binding protein n=1 Tax=Streptomyces sp. NPDC007088 TaxID=3364773 RepID=UPI0036B09C1A